MSDSIDEKIDKINKNILKLKDEKNLNNIIKLQKKIKDDIKNCNDYVEKLEKKINPDSDAETASESSSNEDDEIDIDKCFKNIKSKYQKLQSDDISIEEQLNIKNDLDQKIKNLIKILNIQKLKINETE